MAKRRRPPEPDKLYGDWAVLSGMRQHWLKYGHSEDPRTRTPEQRAWDAAIMTACEYLRRLDGGKERLQLLDLLTSRKFDKP